MGKFLQRYGILFFFCAMMGGIIMVDSIFAIAFTDKERGLATGFRFCRQIHRKHFGKKSSFYFCRKKHKSKP